MTFNPFDPEQAHDAGPCSPTCVSRPPWSTSGTDGVRDPPRRAPPPDARHGELLQRPGVQGPGVVVPLEDRTLGELDPPNHSVVRPVMVTALTPKVVKAAEPYVEATARALLAALPDDGEADLVPTFSSPLPTHRPSTCSAPPSSTAPRSWPGQSPDRERLSRHPSQPGGRRGVRRRVPRLRRLHRRSHRGAPAGAPGRRDHQAGGPGGRRRAAHAPAAAAMVRNLITAA